MIDIAVELGLTIVGLMLMLLTYMNWDNMPFVWRANFLLATAIVAFSVAHLRGLV